jgi:phospholipase/carboxylesterase
MIGPSLTKRSVLAGAAGLTMATRLFPARGESSPEGRLRARASALAVRDPAGLGLHRLGLGEVRDGLVYVPKVQISRVLPLFVILHGAGGSAEQVMPMLQEAAEAHGVLVLAPDSRDRRTWDVIQGAYGSDVRFIDRALHQVFERYLVAPKHVAIGGFSDGASYALSLGLMNGDLFSDVLAFSPGFAAPVQAAGKPRIFISHGARDEVLPVDRCGRRLARELSQAGYDVLYREFSGGHVVPHDQVTAAVGRFLA